MFKHLVFAGGGPRALVYLSALEMLNKHKYLDNIKHTWGNSSGAMMATLLRLNTPLSKIRDIYTTFDFTCFRDFDIKNL